MQIGVNRLRTAAISYFFIRAALMILIGALSGCAMNS
jgi:hypothetical protein